MADEERDDLPSPTPEAPPPETPRPKSPPAPPRRALDALDEVLRRPEAIAARIESGGPPAFLLPLGLSALACFAFYGAAAGCFQGGGQVLLAAAKAPLILLGSLLLCLPSLYVFGSLAGVELSPRALVTSAVGFSALLGLLLVAVLPIVWLFSVSSRYLGFLVLLHVAFWAVALGFGLRFLAALLRAGGATGTLVLWGFLFCLVAFQVTSQLRPVLWRSADEPFVAPGKTFFLEHFARSFAVVQPAEEE